MYGLHIKNNYIMIGIFLPFFRIQNVHSAHIPKKQVTL